MQDDARLRSFDALPTKRVLRAQIDRLSLSADAKAVLNDIGKYHRRGATGPDLRTRHDAALDVIRGS